MVNFDKVWKIALIIILIIGMGFMFWEFKQMNLKGIECAQSPFEYGVQVAIEKNISCSYLCFESGDIRKQIFLK